MSDVQASAPVDYNTAPVDADPEDAPSANSFIVQITLAMFVVVALFVTAAIVDSLVIMILAFICIMFGVGVVLRAIFSMMSTDVGH